MSGPSTPYFLKPLNAFSNAIDEVIYDYTRSASNHGMYMLFCLAKCSEVGMFPVKTGSLLNCSTITLPNCLEIVIATSQCYLC